MGHQFLESVAKALELTPTPLGMDALRVKMPIPEIIPVKNEEGKRQRAVIEACPDCI